QNDTGVKKFAVFVFVVFFSWWAYLQINKTTDYSLQNQIFGASYGVLALFGGIYGLLIAKKWGGFKSIMGKAISFLSLGLLAQVFGQIVYSIYTFYFKIEIPYPSLGDVGYFGSIFPYSFGLYYLAKATGVTFKLKNLKHKLIALIIPLVMLIGSYFIFLRGYEFDWTNPIRVFLDFGYPLGETIYISMALLIYFLSQGILGGIMKPKILFLLFALFIQFLADYSFLYISYYGTIYPGGINDMVYLLAYFLMTISLIKLLSVYNEIKNL
ncbi:MAG: hypothetical protein Q7R95_05000, partial [bacterium]|nr:hypothetical protein [bacterium]